MNLKTAIGLAERSYKLKLEKFFRDHYQEETLPSHGLDHHRRVWDYVKELLEYCKEDKPDTLFIRKLLIASYLHDIGMSAEQGAKHGYHSRKLAKKFLEINNLDQTDYHEVLNAIENHDNKEYNKETSDNFLLKVLSVADDLDAFGHTGINRYTEIYLARGISKDRLGYAVIENAAARFANFKLFAAGKPEFYKKHKKRYLVLRKFFEKYNLQLNSYESGIVRS